MVILGAKGAQVIQLAQRFRLYGASVTLVVSADWLLPHEDSSAGKLLMDYLARDGVRVVLGRTAIRAERDAQGARNVTLDDGTQVQGEGLVVAGVNVPDLDGLGLEHVGVRRSSQGIQIDEHCRAAEGVWAIGGSTGVESSLHMTQYQARIAADDILGHPHPAHYDSVPRITFTSPQVAATGLTLDQAHERGVEVASYSADLVDAASLGTAMTSEHGKPEGEQSERGTSKRTLTGRLTLHADRARGVLIGAWAVDPNAGEWVQLAALAIRAAIPLPVLRDTLEQFPTFSEIYLAALDHLIAADS